MHEIPKSNANLSVVACPSFECSTQCAGNKFGKKYN